MSFSSDVKNELEKQVSSARHCQLAELSAIMMNAGLVKCLNNGQYCIYLLEDSERVSRKFFTILKKAFNIGADVLTDSDRITSNGKAYRAAIRGGDEVAAVLKALRLMDENDVLKDQSYGINQMLIMKSCCKRAFLRDTFLCIGSISDPSKSYHLEFACNHERLAEDLKAVIESFDIDARIIRRKKYYVVYIKESTSIVDLLNVMEAPVSLMNMENERIVKEMRGAINRRVNCETANITKTVNAASRQTADILYLRDHYGFENLPEILRDMAEARLRYPDATLLELGKCLDPPVGKSGVNHRLRKLSELAEKIRG